MKSLGTSLWREMTDTCILSQRQEASPESNVPTGSIVYLAKDTWLQLRRLSLSLSLSLSLWLCVQAGKRHIMDVKYSLHGWLHHLGASQTMSGITLWMETTKKDLCSTKPLGYTPSKTKAMNIISLHFRIEWNSRWSLNNFYKAFCNTDFNVQPPLATPLVVQFVKADIQSDRQPIQL